MMAKYRWLQLIHSVGQVHIHVTFNPNKEFMLLYFIMLLEKGPIRFRCPNFLSIENTNSLSTLRIGNVSKPLLIVPFSVWSCFSNSIFPKKIVLFHINNATYVGRSLILNLVGLWVRATNRKITSSNAQFIEKKNNRQIKTVNTSLAFQWFFYLVLQTDRNYQ